MLQNPVWASSTARESRVDTSSADFALDVLLIPYALPRAFAHLWAQASLAFKLWSADDLGELTLGREDARGAPELAVPASVTAVSNQHGVFSICNGCLFYRDTSSSWGSAVNGYRLDGTCVQLFDGDLLTLGFDVPRELGAPAITFEVSMIAVPVDAPYNESHAQPMVVQSSAQAARDRQRSLSEWWAGFEHRGAAKLVREPLRDHR